MKDRQPWNCQWYLCASLPVSCVYVCTYFVTDSPSFPRYVPELRAEWPAHAWRNAFHFLFSFETDELRRSLVSFVNTCLCPNSYRFIKTANSKVAFEHDISTIFHVPIGSRTKNFMPKWKCLEVRFTAWNGFIVRITKRFLSLEMLQFSFTRSVRKRNN